MKSLQRSGSEAALYVALALGQRAIGFLLIPFMVAALTPEEFGAVSVLTSMVALLTVVMGLSLEIFVFRSSVLDEANESVTSVNSFLFVILPTIGLLVSSSIALMRFEVGNIPSWAFAATIFSSSLAASNFSSLLPGLRAKRQLKTLTIVVLISISVQSSLTLTLVVVQDLGVRGWCVATLTASAATYACGILVCRPRLTWPRLSEPLRLTLPLLPHQVLMWALGFADRWIILIIAGGAATGLYSLAYQCAAVLGLVLMELNRALMSRYVRLSGTAVGKLVVTHLAANTILCSLFMAGTLLLAPVVFRDEYSPAFAYVGPLLFSQYIYGLYCIPINILSLTLARTGRLWRASGIGVAVNLGLNFALIPHLGAWGAVLATVIGYAAMLGVALAYERRFAHLLARSFPLLIAAPIIILIAAQAFATVIESFWYQTATHLVIFASLCVTLLIIVRLQQHGRLERSVT